MPQSGAWAPPEGAIFLSKILILVSFISYVSMVKKANVFLMEKHLIFQNNVENFRSLEILQSRRDFFKCGPAITFDTFTLTNSNVLHMLCTGNTTGK